MPGFTTPGDDTRPPLPHHLLMTTTTAPTKSGRGLPSILRTAWNRAEAPQRFLYAVGGVLLFSALFHMGVFLSEGGSMTGPVSWRKPIAFGLSFGALTITLGWMLDAFTLSRRVTWALAASLGAGSFGEVFLVSLQRWRGVGSHFNVATAFDGAVWAAMGILIVPVLVATTVLLARSFGRLGATPSRSTAIRAGLLLVLAGQGVGLLMMEAGASGAAAFKVPHALALHGLQGMLLVDWLLGRLGRLRQDRRRLGVAAVSAVWITLVLATVAAA